MPEKPMVRLDHPAIFVTALDRSIAFYEAAFGLELKLCWISGKRITNGKEETMDLPDCHLADSCGFRIELRQLADTEGSAHTQKPANHFGMEVSDVAAV